MPDATVGPSYYPYVTNLDIFINGEKAEKVNFNTDFYRTGGYYGKDYG
jgi:hypothetical protein